MAAVGVNGAAVSARPAPERGTTLTQGLVRLIRDRPVRADDLWRAALLVLDAIANALAGRVTGPGGILRRWAAAHGGDAGREALLIGGLVHILETDDLHRASVVHPGCVVVPAAIAVGRRRASRGSAVLKAVLHGFEACCRVGMAVGPAHYRVWHNTATCGPFGSAMATAALLGLDDDRCVDALGNAGTQSAGLWQFLETGAMSKHLHAGRAAEAGVVAAELAALGFTGPAAILEGEKGLFAGACPDPDPGAVLDVPDGPWQVHETSIKPWPSCRHTHPAIDAALEVAESLRGATIERIDVNTYGAALDVCDRPRPGSEYEAKFSLQHCVAAALTDAEIGFGSFDGAARTRLAELSSRTTVIAGEPFSAAYPAAWGAGVSVLTADGNRLAAERTACRGDPERPLDDAQMTEKAKRLMAHGGLDEAVAEAVTASVLALADDAPLPTLDFL